MNRESRYSEETDIVDTGKEANTMGESILKRFRGDALPYLGIKTLNMALFKRYVRIYHFCTKFNC